MAERASRWLAWATVAGFVLALLATLLPEPFVTNDGPVHVAFADLIAHWGAPGRELQHLAYVVDLRLTTNVLTYLLMAALASLGTPAAIESLIQALCLLGPPAAGWLALRTIQRDNAWLAVFLLPLSLHQMFFLGLYNFCLSTIGFLLVVAGCFWMERRPSYGRAVLLGATLTLTLALHAGGFIAAVTGVAAMAIARVVWARVHGMRLTEALAAQRHALVAVAVPVPLALLTLSSSAGSDIDFGPGFVHRLVNTLALRILQLGAKNDVALGMFVSLVLGAALVWAARRVWRARAGLSDARKAAMVAAAVAWLASCITVLVFPDTLGGGWTHIRRFMLFPFYWVLVLLAFVPFTTRARLLLTACACGATVVALGSTLAREAIVRDQSRPWAQVDRLVGAHCTVLPILLETEPVDAAGRPVPMSHNPYFHIASRLEAHGDRVVLFNFLARLDVYPVRFQPHVEPQEHLFRWAPRQHAVAVEEIDVDGFEMASGLHVDYWVLLGDPSLRPGALGARIDALAASSTLVYRSPDERLRLYRRPGANTAGLTPTCS